MNKAELELKKLEARERRTQSIKELMQSIRELKEEIVNLKNQLAVGEKMLYTNQQVMLMFDISSHTIKKWRDEGYISFSQIGDKFLYSAKDIQKFLDHTRYDAYRFDEYPFKKKH